MTRTECALMLDGKSSKEILHELKKHEGKILNGNLCVVFMDDGEINLCGKIKESVYAEDRNEYRVYLTKKRVICISDPDHFENDHDVYKDFHRIIMNRMPSGVVILETNIPHESFRVFEDETVASIGLVFKVSDILK